MSFGCDLDQRFASIVSRYDVVALVSGYATAKQPAPKLFKLLEPAILKQADTYGAEAVSKVAWSYSKLHSGTELLFRRLSSRATAVGIDGFE